MGRVESYALVLLLVQTTMINFRVSASADSPVAESFEANCVVPDVISKAPATLALVIYSSGVEAMEGNELTPTEVKDYPSVTWDGDPDALYTVAMLDPDAPSRDDPEYREWLHWLVGNIACCAVDSGEVIAEYVGAAPSLGTGFHRYVILVYRQPGELCFDEPRLNNTSTANRTGFSIEKFAQKYELGDPLAGNFFQAQYDDYVPVLLEQLGA